MLNPTFTVGSRRRDSDRIPTAWTAEKSETIHGAGIVLKWVRGDKEANFRRIEPMIREAARHRRSWSSRRNAFWTATRSTI